jgi:uncharacterized protein (DUF4213/DUF364 family)
MKILHEIISSLDLNASVRDIRQGVFQTAVWTRQCGLASTLPRDALRQEPPMVGEAGALLEKSPQELADYVFSKKLLEAAMGMATINSLLAVDESSCVEKNAAELILEKGEGKRIAVIGHFPFISRLKQHAKALWVIERNPKTGDLTEADGEATIPRADVVALTGTSLTNHTFENLLALCRPDAYVIILGDTAPLTPIFFDHGVDAVAGTKVVDPETAIRCVSQGANFRQIKGTRRLILMK